MPSKQGAVPGAMSRRSVIDFVTLAALWGASFMFMRVGAQEFGAMPTAGLRVGIAALFLLPILILDGGHILIALYEMLFRRAPNERVLVALINTALVLLLSLFLFITIRDTGRVKYYLGPSDDPAPPAATTNAPPAKVP